MGGVTNSYMVPLPNDAPFWKKSKQGWEGGGWCGQILTGPLLHFVSSERKADRGTREMSGGPTPTCGHLLLSFCKEVGQG